jgi:hypothetical protein
LVRLNRFVGIQIGLSRSLVSSKPKRPRIKWLRLIGRNGGD